jgi:TRAP-type C4-dicarboxylate transport system substrate-binding protein
VAIDTFAKEVEKRTGGRYKIQNFYASALGGEREAIEAVQLGTQELAFTSTGPCPTSCRDAKILDIPSCSATRRTRAPCWMARSARKCCQV